MTTDKIYHRDELGLWRPQLIYHGQEFNKKPWPNRTVLAILPTLTINLLRKVHLVNVLCLLSQSMASNLTRTSH